MSFVLLDDGFYDHPKTIAAGNEAAGAYARALSWSGKHPTDGHVPMAIWEAIGGRRTPKILARLRAVGFIDDCQIEAETGLNHGQNCARIHDYTDTNRSADEVLERREAERIKKANWRANRRDPATQPAGQTQLSPRDVPPNVHGTTGGQTEGQNGGRPRSPRARTRAGSARVPPSPSPSPKLVSSSLDGPLTYQDVRANGTTADHQNDQPQPPTDHEWTESLTLAAHQLRPDWTLAGIRDAITRARPRALSWPRLSVALIAVASSGDTEKPHRILADGWWWDDGDSRLKNFLASVDDTGGLARAATPS